MCQCNMFCYTGINKRLTEKHGKGKSLLKQAKREVPLDIDGHDFKTVLEDPDKPSPFRVVLMWLS